MSTEPPLIEMEPPALTSMVKAATQPETEALKPELEIVTEMVPPMPKVWSPNWNEAVPVNLKSPFGW